MAYQKVEVWVVIDSEGNVEAAGSADDAAERYNALDVDELLAIRFLKLKLDIEIPDPITISANLPAKTGVVEMTVTG